MAQAKRLQSCVNMEQRLVAAVVALIKIPSWLLLVKAESRNDSSSRNFSEKIQLVCQI